MNDNILCELYQVVLVRRSTPQEGSYTCYLFDKGRDKILKKVGEECAETIIAAKNGIAEDTVGEISDLLYHLMVLMADQAIPLDAVLAELDRRSQKIGNLKQMKPVDHESLKRTPPGAIPPDGFLLRGRLKRLRAGQPRCLRIGDKDGVQSGQGIPYRHIHDTALFRAVEPLDAADVALSGFIQHTVYLIGFDLLQNIGHGLKHGLNDIDVDVGLPRLNGVVAVWEAGGGAWSTQALKYLPVERGNGVPCSVVHLAGNRREKLSLEDHDRLQGALPKQAVRG